MGGPWGISSNVECSRGVLDHSVRVGASLMLAEMLDPRFDHEGLDVPCRVGDVMVHTPPDGSISPSQSTQGVKSRCKVLTFVGIDSVFNRDQDRPLVWPWFDLDLRRVPRLGSHKVEAAVSRHGPAGGCRQSAEQGCSRDDQGRAGASFFREGTPEDTA